MLAVSTKISVYGPETAFAVPEPNGTTGRRRSVAQPDRKPESVRALAERLPPRAWQTLPCRTTPAGEEVEGRFAFVRVVATHPVRNDHQPPREESLIVEWPAGAEAPPGYWLSNLPADTDPERLARLARLRWTIELDYRQLKGELGLDHYEGRSYNRLPPPHSTRHLRTRLPHPRTARPKSPAAGLTLPQAVQLLQPVLHCWTGRCRTCDQPVDLEQLALFHRRE